MTSNGKHPDDSFWKAHPQSIFLVVLFVVVFLITRLTLRPINYIDYIVFTGGLDKLFHGSSPYTFAGYLVPPWTIFITLPLAYQPLETWLALSVAIFVVLVFDTPVFQRNAPAGLLLLIHPIFITLIASSNPEWILVGPGLWLLDHFPRGWGRGLAWVFLTTKPQTTIVLLIFEGIVALRQRDWKAIGIAAVIAIGTFIIFPQPIEPLLKPHDWSASVIAHYGLIGAIAVTALILVLRRHNLRDYKTLGIFLSPVWTPYNLQYNYVVVLYTMRHAGWIRNIIYLIAGIALALVFWQEYHVAEHVGILGMLLLAVIFAPSSKQTHATNLPALNKSKTGFEAADSASVIVDQNQIA